MKKMPHEYSGWENEGPCSTFENIMFVICLIAFYAALFYAILETPYDH
jgi:hypothetical protein